LETPQVRKLSIVIIEHTYSRCQILDSRGTPPSFVALIIPTPPANHRTLAAPKAVPRGAPSTSHTPSTAYPSPLAVTTHLPLHTHLKEPISDS
jgi:hypothetical protein